ncbi:MAG: hypothetical protein IJO57_02465, partial [Bacilli bacterium]|nr:hypothetical protein [Bacilli bacterium]
YEEYGEDYIKYYDVEGNLQRVDYSDGRYEEYGEDYIKYYDVEGNLQRVDYSDGRYEEYGEDYIKYYDENGKLISKKYEDGRYVKYKENREVLYSKTGEELLAKYYDGVVCYKIDGLNWVTYPGDYFFCELEDGTKINGTYKIDENGNVEFTNSETNETNVYDINEYKITKTIFPDGSSLEYEIDNGSILKHNSNRQLISVSNINSIDFDEERYNAIMKKLNSIYELKVGVEASYNNCISEIDAFPDKFSSFNRNSNLFDFYENIYKLKNKINYSSLAYKGYDKDLKDYLDDLIDEIFEEKNTKYLNKFQDDIKDLTNDSNNDGILDYNRDVNFKELDTEMFKSILINGYGFEILDDSSAKELGLSESDKHNIVYSPIIKNINGVDFQCYYGFNIDDIDDPKKLIEDAEECIQFTREKYNNPGVLASLKKAGLKFAFDNVYDGHGAGWYWPPYKLIKTHCIFDENKGILEHEIGHAVDYLLLPDDNDRNYRNIIENSYNSGNPMYLRINVDNTNNNYISIKYGSDGLPYCEGADGSKVLLDYNVLNNGGAVNVDGYEYVVATKKEAKKHIEEVFAETSRYNYVDTGVLLSRMMATGKDREDTYLLTADCLTWYLSEYQNEDISWYTDFLDEGDK